jgi:hypothetical protein
MSSSQPRVTAPPPQRAPIITNTTDYAACQARRRRDALGRQASARAARVADARALVAEQQQHQHQQHQPARHPPPPPQQQVGEEEEARPAAGAAAAAASAAAAKQQREQQQQRQRQLWYAGQLMVYDWLAALPLPPDLGPRAWLVMPRPGGVRCLVTSGRGTTVARAARTGRPLPLPLPPPSAPSALSFASLLPGGSSRTAAGPEAHCALDCVLLPPPPSTTSDEGTAPHRPHPHPQPRFTVLDVVEWRGVALAGCSAGARQGWLAAKAAEGELESGLLPAHAFARGLQAAAGPAAAAARFALAGAAPATAAAVAEAAGGGAAAARGWPEQEGVLFLHSDGDYVGGGARGAPWPLALAWKDARCAAYVVDTPIVPAGAAGASVQTAVLRLEEAAPAAAAAAAARPPSARALDAATADDPPHVLARGLPERPVLGAAPGALHRFAVLPAAAGGEAAAMAADVVPSLLPLGGEAAALVHKGPAGPLRLHADGMSKIVFQAMARRGLLPTLEELVAAAVENGGEGGVEGGGDGDGGGDEEMAA